MQNDFDAIVKLPRHWARETKGFYTYCLPAGGILPESGWKIFVSCHFGNAAHVIQRAASIFSKCTMPFKYVQSRFDLATNILGKHKPSRRGDSAKAVVGYPKNTEHASRAIKKLADALDGVEAPPVLSGKQFAKAPVFYRWYEGGLAIQPWYEIPEGMTDPFQSDSDVDEKGDGDEEFLVNGYRIQEAVYFSNSGGIYIGTDMKNRICCIKEGRRWLAPNPHTGADSVDRLEREADLLAELNAHTPFLVPKFVDFFVDYHAFLVREYCDGATLSEFKTRKESISSRERLILKDALESIMVLKKLLPADKLLDLSPENLIFDGETIKIIDLECVEYGENAVFGTKGFLPPNGFCPWRWAIDELLKFCTAAESAVS